MIDGYVMLGNTSLVSRDATITSKLPCATPTKHLHFAMEQVFRKRSKA